MRNEIIQLVADFLLQKGVDVQIECKQAGWDCTMLHEAAFRNQSDLIRLLVKMGADVNAEVGDDGTPLSWAAENGIYEATKTLIECGADVNYASRGVSVLRSARGFGKYEVAKLLKEHGAKE